MNSMEPKECSFDSLSEDNHICILDFLGRNSYFPYGSINKKCNSIFQICPYRFPKTTFFQGYAKPEFVILRFEEEYDPGRVTCIIGSEYDEIAYEDQNYRNSSDHDVFRKVARAIVMFRRLDLLRWALENQNRFLIFAICYEAAYADCKIILEAVMSLLNKEVSDYITKNGELGHGAAWKGNLTILKYLHEKGCNFDSEYSECCTYAAAAAGQVEVLEFLQNVGCKSNIDTCCTAAKWGQVKVLKWLKGIGIEPNSETFAEAAHGRDLHKYQKSLPNIHERKIRQMEVLTYLLENKCPWDHKTFEGAALSAPIKVLEFLKRNGCPWSPIACEYAAQFHRTETLKWFKYNGYEWDYYDTFLKETGIDISYRRYEMMRKGKL